MKNFILATFTLAFFPIVMGEKCLMKQHSSSELKCGSSVYKRSQEFLDAYNSCAKGKEGQEASFMDAVCLFTKRGYIADMNMKIEKLHENLKLDFPNHHDQLFNGFKGCAPFFELTAAMKNPKKPVECMNRAYEEVCGHKTCDWINSL